MENSDKVGSGTVYFDQPRGVSRREVLTGAGVIAAGVGLATAASAMPGLDTADKDTGLVGVADSSVNAVEFRSRIAQTGESFVSVGYLTKVAGATETDLFAATVHNEGSALLTVYSEGTLEQRALDQKVHALDIVGTLTIYQRPAPGASYANPASFRVGTPVAQFALRLHDILTVIAPGQGLPTLTGDLSQTAVGRVPSVGKHFGRMGMRARFFATGLGQLNDPVTLSATFEMAGNWTVDQ
jgi:hypothetical protein